MQSVGSCGVMECFGSEARGSASVAADKRILGLSFVSNLVGLFIKGAVGILCGSQALVADALHTFSDVVSFGINYAGSHGGSPAARQTAFAQSVLIGIIIFLSGVWILADNAIVLIDGSSPRPGLLGPVVAGGAILTNWYLFVRSRRAYHESKDASTYICVVQNKTNLLCTCLALVGMVLADVGLVLLDPICAIGVGCLLFKAAFDVFRRTFAEHPASSRTRNWQLTAVVGALAGCIIGFSVYDRLTRNEVILIPAHGTATTSAADDVLGRAEYFLVFNTTENTVTPIFNAARHVSGDVSDSLIGTIELNHVNVVLASKIGTEMFSDLQAAGVSMYYVDRPGTVEQTLTAYRDGLLARATAPNVAKGYGRGKVRWFSPW